MSDNLLCFFLQTYSLSICKGFEDLLGKFEENNILADHPSQHGMMTSETSSDPFLLISNLDTARRGDGDHLSNPTKGTFLYVLFKKKFMQSPFSLWGIVDFP